jgi:trimeric autotransporter adhesin
VDNSATDAKQFSLTGQDLPKPAYNDYTLTGLIQGPLRIPHLLRNGPTFFLQYQMTRNRNDTATDGLVPTLAQRNGDLSSLTGTILDPATGTAFPNNQIPQNQISPQAAALLKLFPLPNFTGSSVYNYQAPLVSLTHSDGFISRMNKQIGRKNSIQGVFALTSTRSTSPQPVFGFLDTTSTLGMNLDPVWRHQWTPRVSSTLEFQFTRNAPHQYSFFSNNYNVSGNAGITGNYQQPLYWGPPALNFGTSGFYPLSDGSPSFNRAQTGLLKSDSTWNHGRHNVTFGGDVRRQEFNYLSETNARGSLTFNGLATEMAGIAPGTANPFADFLLGIPDSVTLAYGNADKYLRATGYDAYVNDDWRVNSSLTLNIGLRYEYNAPVSELYGRLVNLDVAPGFTAIAPVLGNDTTGTLTGEKYPDSLIRPERYPFEPSLGYAWRPISGSSLVVRGGYGLRFINPQYSGIAANMFQQAPFSQSLQVDNTPSTPLTLADPFVGSPQYSAYTFGIDPNFKESYAQNWTFSIQRDLPAGMQMVLTYAGLKGTRMPQYFYPNSYAPDPNAPNGGNPCLLCPVGFKYETSNADSTREAGSIQLRRRLHNGFLAQGTYTYAKAIDNTGGIAQNWLDLSAERGLSSFDQRQNLTVQLQYTSGMGLGGGSLISGWKAAVLKEWTLLTPITWGTGMPLTPNYQVPLGGTTAYSLRPNYTGANVYAAPAGLFLNPQAIAAPLAGEYGDAGVGSITGPAQFSMGASLQRTFRVNDRTTFNLRVDSVNVLNHVVFTSYTVALGPQFGAPPNGSANGMRTLKVTGQFRF